MLLCPVSSITAPPQVDDEMIIGDLRRRPSQHHPSDAPDLVLGPGRDARDLAAVGLRWRWAAARRPARDSRRDGRGAPVDCRRDSRPRRRIAGGVRPSRQRDLAPSPSPDAYPELMKFDLLYELQMPKPHDERSEWRCYQEALEQIELADRLGFDTVWAVEHHFLTEFAHSSAPEVFLGALSQRDQAHPHRPRRRAAAASSSTIRSASPSGSRRSTSCPTAGSSSAPAARASTSRRASRSTPSSRATCGRSRSR